MTHFFNPPRYLRLLEVVAGEKTRPDAVAAVSDFADRELGKSVVPCHDTPGFIANRLGCAWLGWALAEAVARGLSVEEADAIVSAAFGCPKTGVFGLLDLVGIDLVLVVERSFRDRLGRADPFLGIEWPRKQLEAMVADGRTGRKGDGGFYRLAVVDGRRTKLALDMTSDTYRPAERPRRPERARSGLRALVEAPDEGAAYAWAILSSTLAYAAWLVPEVSDSPAQIDRALETGYGWARGPFRLADELGAGYLAQRLATEERPVPRSSGLRPLPVGSTRARRVTSTSSSRAAPADRLPDPLESSSSKISNDGATPSQATPRRRSGTWTTASSASSSRRR